MTKNEFMNQLEVLLKDLPSEEREAALTYYDDYFEDAGSDNTEHVIMELVSPERVATIIKSNISDNEWKDSDQIIYTENGYKDTTVEENRFEVVSNDYQEFAKDTKNNSKQNSDTFQNKDTVYKEKNIKNNQKTSNTSSKVLLIIILCIIAIPIGIPVLGTAFGLIAGAIATVFGLFVALLAITGSFLFAGIVLFIAGVIQLFIIPINGILMCGVGLLLLGLGTLATMVTIFVCTKVIPTLVRAIVDLCKLPFKKRGEVQ